MRDWSSGQILRTAIADAYRSRMGGANPICIDLRRAAIMPVETIGRARINCESAQSFDPQSAQGQEDLP